MAQSSPAGSDWRRPPYASYIASLYEDGVFGCKLPIVTTNPNLLEEQARKTMNVKSFGYIYGGAGALSTMDANLRAFRQWEIIPRILKPCNPRDLSIQLFGSTYESPVLMAPIGVQSMFHPSGETGLVEACKELGVPYTLSTAATSTIEVVALACGSHSRWFQLYWPRDTAITSSLLRRAKESGYSTLVVTLDTVAVAWRPLDLDVANMPFLKGVGNAVGFSDSAFRTKFMEVSNGETPETDCLSASRHWISQVYGGEHHSWKDLEILRKNWDGPIVLKGVLNVEDARLALQHGVDGIIVSNHGGRQLDGSVTSIEMLPRIADAVGNDMVVMFDSGIRTGTDIIKALALGARAVFVGRPVLYGYGIGGKEGAKAVLAGLLADLDQSMGISGFGSISDLSRSILWKHSQLA